ncbi:MAG: hypothetical protein ACAI25_19615 [Planctomycetota bacterium]
MKKTVLALVLLAASTARADDTSLFAGEQCAEKVLSGLGSAIDATDVFALSGVDPTLGRGCEPAELARALEKLGFVSPLARAKTNDELWTELLADLEKGRPSALHLSSGWRLVRAADKEGLKKDELVSALTSPTRVRFEVPATLGERPAKVSPSARALAAHCHGLRKKIPENWTVVIERPFVVTGDGNVKRSARSTVAWSVKLLKAEYFAKDPDEIITIWLFDGKESYESNTQKFFKEDPGTPYGYYSPKHKALIMNIATGGGTLVHEIVHPFVRANFPECPSWFNEGLASLYEQCGEEDGRIHGYTNWRLAGLQKAIKKGGLTSFEDLSKTTSNQFYGDDKGTNYAQARYLCYYLQQNKLLQDYWKTWVKDQKDDPTGYKSLKKVLKEEDMKAFQERWEKWVLTLTYP